MTVIDSNEPIPTIEKFLQLLHAIFADDIFDNFLLDCNNSQKTHRCKNEKKITDCYRVGNINAIDCIICVDINQPKMVKYMARICAVC
ncbi:hypothetical protein B9Z40_05375 [Limnohabitans sp. 15K]|nr:hypothetical protein B9Z40_05375 [Limnohabitans sp. 15K]